MVEFTCAYRVLVTELGTQVLSWVYDNAKTCEEQVEPIKSVSFTYTMAADEPVVRKSEICVRFML